MNWPMRPLGDVTRKIGSGATPRGGSSVYVGEGALLIRSQNVLDNRLSLDGVARISDEASRALAGVAVETGDVLVNITGDSIARVAQVKRDIGEARVNQHVAIVRPNGLVQAGFLQKYLASPEAKARLLSLSQGGATRKALTKAQLGQFLVPVPPLPEQQAIAEVLGALDDKIEANRRVAEVADEARRASYQSMLDGLERPLSSLAEFVNGRAYTKDASGTGRVVIRIAELNSGLGGSTVYNDVAVPDENLARPGDLLFAWSGSLVAHRWYRPEGIVNQHIFKVIPKPGWPLWLVSCALDRKLEAFKAIAADKATTMGHIQRRHLDELVAVPSGDQMAAADRGMAALWHRALAAEVESLILAHVRDALLPHLMSGRITVRQAVALVEEVL